MITVYSDGGADNKGSAGGAAVIEGISSNPVLFVACLGDATNNEGEIFSAIMGISCAILLVSEGKANKIKWVSDSEYSLKSATQYINNWVRNGWKTSQNKPVKNQGLWKTFLSLTEGIKIIPEHVKGHSGHIQNEACDSAVSWMRSRQNDIKEGIHDIETESGSEWMVIDARSILKKIRKSDTSGIDKSEMLDFFSSYIENIKTNTKTNLAQDKSETHKKVQKLTKAYFNKLDQIDPKQSIIREEKEFAKAIEKLKKWIELSE